MHIILYHLSPPCLECRNGFFTGGNVVVVRNYCAQKWTIQGDHPSEAPKHWHWKCSLWWLFENFKSPCEETEVRNVHVRDILSDMVYWISKEREFHNCSATSWNASLSAICYWTLWMHGFAKQSVRLQMSWWNIQKWSGFMALKIPSIPCFKSKG